VTPKQLEVLRYVEDFTQRNGYSPTLQEVADHLKITKVTVLSHLRQLEKARHVKRSYYRRRGIEILTSTRRLPVTGRIAAGRPIEAIVHPDELDVLGVMKPGKEYFALEVRGNSMIEDHIRDGDYVIVERTPSALWQDKQQLALIATERLGIPFQPHKVPIALQVDDVAASRAKLESRGVTFTGETIDSGVCHQALFEDPDGNVLDLHHRYAPRTKPS